MSSPKHAIRLYLCACCSGRFNPMEVTSVNQRQRQRVIVGVAVISMVVSGIIMFFAFRTLRREGRQVDVMQIHPARFYIPKRLPEKKSIKLFEMKRAVFNAAIGKTPQGNWFSVGRDCSSNHLNLLALTAISSSLWSNFHPELLQTTDDSAYEIDSQQEDTKNGFLEPWSRYRYLDLLCFQVSMFKKGAQDTRMFNWHDECYAIYNATYDGKPQMHVSRLDITEVNKSIINIKVNKKSTVILRTEDGSSTNQPQKNWTAWDKGDDILRFIYKVTNGQVSVLRCPSLEEGICYPEKSGSTFTSAGVIRKSLVLGSSGGSVLVMGHRMYGDYQYYNICYLFTKEEPYTITKVSKMFLLRDSKCTFNDFDYIMSAVFIQGQLVVSGGRSDKDCFFVSLTPQMLTDTILGEDEKPFLTMDQWTEYIK